MKPTVYVETTIFSALAARPTKESLAAERHRATRQWWHEDADKFTLFTSEVVRAEASDGDSEMAARRLLYIAAIPCLVSTNAAVTLSEAILDRGLLPAKASVDALHLTIATTHRLDYLITWNCRHLANPRIGGQIERYLRQNGYTMPCICTLHDLCRREP